MGSLVSYGAFLVNYAEPLVPVSLLRDLALHL